MTSRLLQAIGLLAVFGAVAFTAMGLAVLKDRIQVTVQAADAGARPDPTALLRDDLQAMAAQVEQLAAATGENFSKLFAATEAGELQRHGEVLAALRAHGAAPLPAEQMAVRLSALEVAVRELSERLPHAAHADPAPGAASSDAEPAPAASVARAAPEPEPALPASEPVAGPEGVATGPRAAAQGPKFLTFAVPGNAFRFDEPQDYVILGELSRVGFDARSTLHDFSGVTSAVEGAFRADFDDPEGAWRGSVSCRAGTLATGVDGRDEGLREHLDTERHPTIRFELQRFVPAPDGVDVARQTARGEVVGTMTIRGTSRELRMPVRVSVDASKRVVIEGEVPLLLSDYGVPVPNKLGLVKMQDEVKVWVSLRARRKAGS